MTPSSNELPFISNKPNTTRERGGVYPLEESKPQASKGVEGKKQPQITYLAPITRMGNQHPCRLVVRVDEPPHATHQAGGFLTGRVFFHASSEADLANFESINLILEGEEIVTVPRRSRLDMDDEEEEDEENEAPTRVLPLHPPPAGNDSDSDSSSSRMHSRDTVEAHPVTFKKSICRTTFVSADACVVQFQDKLEPGQYEFPFRFRLPRGLPGSMLCKDGEINSSSAEIRYSLSTFVEMKNGGDSSGDENLHDSTNIHVTATHPETESQPISIHSKVFPVSSCCSWRKGTIELGWKANMDVCTPGSTLLVDIAGENHSRVHVENLVVKLVETVVFRSEFTNSKKSVRRNVCKQYFVASSFPWWKPMYTSKKGAPVIQPHEIDIVVPPVVRDSYSGPLIGVSHNVVITVETKGRFGDRSFLDTSFPIRVVRTPAQVPTAPVYSANPCYRHPKSCDTEPEEPPAADWHPVIMEVVLLDPEETSTVLWTTPTGLDDEIKCTQSEPSLTTTVSTPVFSATSEPAAPPDSVSLSEPSHPVVEKEPGYWRSPSIEDLQDLVDAYPDNLEENLDDEVWLELLQRLSPRDYCSIVQSAPYPCYVARTLAAKMGDAMTTRHILASIYSIKEPRRRIEVLCQIAPFISDLSSNIEMIESELSEDELASFRAALRCH